MENHHARNSQSMSMGKRLLTRSATELPRRDVTDDTPRMSAGFSVVAPIPERMKGIVSLNIEASSVTGPATGFGSTENIGVVLDDRPRDTSPDRWNHALIEATQVAMNWQVKSILQGLSLDALDSVDSITYRPYSLLDPHYRALVPTTNAEDAGIVTCAVELVRNGYRPTTCGGKALPRSNDEHASEQNPGITCMLTLGELAHGLLDVLWPVIDELATAACAHTRVSMFETWDIFWPDTTPWLEAEAYHLAARAVACRVLGIVPVYLSIFNRDGNGSQFVCGADQTREVTMEEKGILGYIGMNASLRATGKMVVNEHDPDFIAVRNDLPGGDVVHTPAEIARAKRGVARIQEITSQHWDTIETLAKLLLREYCLLGEEISYVLDGGDVESWVRLY